jgi:hypothetical protein
MEHGKSGGSDARAQNSAKSGDISFLFKIHLGPAS